MCDDHGASAAHPEPWQLSRRGVLKGMVALAAVAGLQGAPRTAQAAPLPPRPPSADGLRAFVMGMHLHASASEGTGSMRSHLQQAALNGFDVAWFTEHDWRRRRLLFRPAYHFVPNESAVGGVWNLAQVANIGSLAATSGALQVTSPVSPFDLATKKASLRLRATSTGSALATIRRRINATPSRGNFRGRITGRTVSLDILPTQGGPNAWGEVLFTLSHHLGSGSRPTGVCSLLYRLRPDLTTRVVSSQGTTGIIDLPVIAGVWQTLTFDLTDDVAGVWPDMDPRDNALSDLDFRASSQRRAPAEIFFGNLRFDEQTGYDAVGVENGLVTRYAGEVPSVLGLVGTEISLGPHLNQYGGVQAPYDYGVTSLAQDVPATSSTIVDFIHTQGGIASINHPFKPGDSGKATSAAQVARGLLATRAGGADLLEVGYSNRDGATLPQYLAVWDALSRNAVFVTGNGATDDHSGVGWASQKNRFYTAGWAPALGQTGLMDALRSGRAYAGQLGGFGGTIDMAVDDVVRMGAVSVGGATSRTLRIDVSGLPTGGAVQVLRGAVDYVGTADPNPNTAVVQTLNAAALASGNQLTVDAGSDCFYRLQVITSAGAVVGFGQPIWLLRTAPPTGVPVARQA